MAKKVETARLTDTLAEFKELKNIDGETLIEVMRESFRNVLAKMFGSDKGFTILLNDERGDFDIYRTRVVVEDGEIDDENLQIELSKAQEIDEHAEVDEEVTENIDFSSFGRRAVLNLRQALASKIQDLQRASLKQSFEERIGQMVSAEVYQVWKREALLLDDEGNELLMPKSEQIPSDFFRKGDTVHAVIERVEESNNNVRIITSRTSGEFLKRLFELNVPEIADGLITIRTVARIPGERAKMAVESYDERIDPIGACVGMNGSRIRGIVRELRGENIDVMAFSSNPSIYIQRALSPAKVSYLNLSIENKTAEVYLHPDEIPLAIGKNASNLNLAKALTGYQIEVFRDIDEEKEEDIYLDEFNDEIEQWVIDILKEIGCDTAKSVLGKSREFLIHQTDLEESTIDNVIRILKAEFSDEEELTDTEAESDGNEEDSTEETQQND